MKRLILLIVSLLTGKGTIELEYSNSSDEAQIFLLKFFHSSNL